MDRKLVPLLLGAMCTITLISCGADPKITQFKKDMDDFCASVSQLNDEINQIDAESENAPSLALDYLDKLDILFGNFAELDFPETYDYLEPVADEASQYMKVAVENYHLAYADGLYDEEKAEYARENSARAFKRVQVIVDILQGNVSDAETQSESIEN